MRKKNNGIRKESTQPNIQPNQTFTQTKQTLKKTQKIKCQGILTQVAEELEATGCLQNTFSHLENSSKP